MEMTVKTSSKEESIQIINNLLNNSNLPNLNGGEVKDWGIVGGELVQELIGMVEFYISEMYSCIH